MISAVPVSAWVATLVLLAVIVYVDLRVIARRDSIVAVLVAAGLASFARNWIDDRTSA